MRPSTIPLMSKPFLRVAVIMERTTTNNRWLPEKWEAKGIVPDISEAGAVQRVIRESAGQTQMLFPGLPVTLERDETEGYYLNLTSPVPKAFVLWRMQGEIAVPAMVTVSYNEGTRWADGGEAVDGVPLPAELYAWIGGFVETHYRPEPNKTKNKRFASNADRGVGGRWNG